MKFLKTILTYILAFTSGIKKTAEAVNGSADYEEFRAKLDKAIW